MVAYIKYNLKFADYIGVQTLTMKNRISTQFQLPFDNIFIVPNAISFTSIGEIKQENDPKRVGTTKKLLFLSKYFPHKNFEILIDVALLIKERNLSFQFTVTLDEDENEGGKSFLKKVNALELDQIIVNIGNVSLAKIGETYNKHDGLFLPTLLESYSGTYIEAMYFEKPIFTSNLDFAIDTCKDAGFYFDPFNAENIVEIITNAFSKPQEIRNRTAIGKKYIESISSWSDIGRYLDENVLMI